MSFRGAAQRYAPYPSPWDVRASRVRQSLLVPPQASLTKRTNLAQITHEPTEVSYPLPGILLQGLRVCGLASVSQLRELSEGQFSDLCQA